MSDEYIPGYGPRHINYGNISDVNFSGENLSDDINDKDGNTRGKDNDAPDLDKKDTVQVNLVENHPMNRLCSLGGWICLGAYGKPTDSADFDLGKTNDNNVPKYRKVKIWRPF